MASVENLAQLLGSRRVGPRQLALAVPEVRAGCGPLAAAISSLEPAVAEELADDSEGQAALAELLAHAQRRALDLGRALEGRELSPIVARERLALESIVRPIADELDTLVRLIDLVSTAATSRSTEIDLRDVIAERRSSSRRRKPPVRAVIELDAPLLLGDARVVLDLLEFAALFVFRAGVTEPHIEARSEGGEHLTITVAKGLLEEAGSASSSRKVLEIPVRAAVPRDIDVVRTAARRAGIDFSVASDGGLVSIAF